MALESRGAQRCYGTQTAPEMNGGQERTGSQQQTGGSLERERGGIVKGAEHKQNRKIFVIVTEVVDHEFLMSFRNVCKAYVSLCLSRRVRVRLRFGLQAI